MNNPVTFPIAKLLKEKGFNVPCFGYFWNDLKKLQFMSSTSLPTVFHTQKFWKENSRLYTISAPTIAQVIMWLYEKHGIWVNVNCDCYGELWYAKLSVASKINWDDIDKRNAIIQSFRKFSNEQKSPTEAYLAAIEYTLNNLI